MGELMNRLLGTQRSADTVACGEPLALYLPAAAGPAAGLTLTGPAGEDTGHLVGEGGGVLWRSVAAGAPGVYQVMRGERVVFAAAIAVPPEESDLRALEPHVFQGRLAGGRRLHYRARRSAPEEEPRDDLWVWLAVGCVGCLLAEVMVLKVFRV